MNIDVSSDSFRAQLDDAIKLLRAFSQSNNLTIDTAISIIMAAANHEGGVDAMIAMEKASSAIAMDYGNAKSQSRQQRRWEARQATNLKTMETLREGFPDIFTSKPLHIFNPSD